MDKPAKGQSHAFVPGQDPRHGPALIRKEGSRLYHESDAKIELLFPIIADETQNNASIVRNIGQAIQAGAKQSFSRAGNAIIFTFVSPAGTDAAQAPTVEFASPFFRLFENNSPKTDWLPCAWYATRYDFAPAAITPGVAQVAIPATMPLYRLDFSRVDLWNPTAHVVTLNALLISGRADVRMNGGA